jgi:putative serine protease PepD
MIISSDGLILTNAHVLAGATSITVTFDGQTSTHAATLVGEDAAKDIALIKVSGESGLPTVTLASSTGVQTGDSVLAIGNALDLQSGGFTVSNGIISGLNRAITTDNDENLTGLLQTSAAISSGDSGGALVDAAGQVIGMNTAAASSSSTNTAQDIGFAISSNEISSLLGQLQKGNIGTPTVGSSSSSSSSSSAVDPNEGSGTSGGYSFEYGSPYGSSY